MLNRSNATTIQNSKSLSLAFLLLTICAPPSATSAIVDWDNVNGSQFFTVNGFIDLSDSPGFLSAVGLS